MVVKKMWNRIEDGIELTIRISPETLVSHPASRMNSTSKHQVETTLPSISSYYLFPHHYHSMPYDTLSHGSWRATSSVEPPRQGSPGESLKDPERSLQLYQRLAIDKYLWRLDHRHINWKMLHSLSPTVIPKQLCPAVCLLSLFSLSVTSNAHWTAQKGMIGME